MPDPSPSRLSPSALRAIRVVVVMLAVLVAGGALSVALGGAFVNVPVAVVAAFAAYRVARAPVRGG